MVIQHQTDASQKTDTEETEQPLGERNHKGARIFDLGANACVMGSHRVPPNQAGHDQVDEQTEARSLEEP